MRSNFLRGSSVLLVLIWLLAGCASQPSPPPGVIKITSNPQYDARMAKRIATQWHALLNSSALDYNTGSVTVAFILYSDGSVSDVRITANNVGVLSGWICVEAILKSDPFPKWSQEMVKTIGKNHCDANFTFNYQGQ